MLLNIIFAVMIIFLMVAVFIGMWKLGKWMVIPIQIILFALLIFVVFKVFATRENAEKLHAELEKSGIAEVEKGAVSGAINALKKTKEKNNPPAAETEKEASAADTAEKPAEVPTEKPADKPVEKSADKPVEKSADKPANRDFLQYL